MKYNHWIEMKLKTGQYKMDNFDISLYGGTGFVGGTFYDTFKNLHNIKLVPRYSRRPDADSEILYCISTTHNYNVFTDPTLDVKTNLNVLTETLESWKNHNPDGVFNFVSSWFVYGDNKFKYVDENAPCFPKGFYSITKLCAEQLVESFASTFNLKYRILRLGNVIGKGDKGASAQKNAFQYLFNGMREGAPTIPVYEHGEFYRNYSHVGDIAQYLRFVMRHGELNTVYNIGNYENYKFMDMLECARLATRWQGRYEFIEQKDFHKKVQVKSFHMDCGKLWSLGKPNHQLYRLYAMENMIHSLL